mmetsp:Transcript_4478/g.12189  ORF Transcript_4478/g.12189 Transcript_4478/m.12189 type:complete len:236 (+) Transcript_4478:1515-2222(+)
MAWHCTASSRVGIITMAFVATGPEMTRPEASRRRARTLGLWQRRSKAGSRNDAVLPEPVSAVASTSRPWRAGGMTSLWMGVGDSKPKSVTALRSGRESRRSAKWIPVCRWLFSPVPPDAGLFSAAFFFVFSLAAASGFASAASPSPRRSRNRASIFAARPFVSAAPAAGCSIAWWPSKSQPPPAPSSSSLTRSPNVMPFFERTGPSSSALASGSSSPSTVRMRSDICGEAASPGG